MGDFFRFRKGAGVRWWIFGAIVLILPAFVRGWLRSRNAAGSMGPFPWLRSMATVGIAVVALLALILALETLRAFKERRQRPSALSSPFYPCPSCGFLVFGEPPGSFEICEVCGWEDDVVQLEDPTFAGGANIDSLATSQAEILKFHPPEIAEENGVRRDPRWRPLRDEDLRRRTDEEPGYYWLRHDGS